MERSKGFPSLETLVFCIVDTRLIMGAWWISWIDFPFSCRKIYIALNCETIRPPAPDNRWLGGWLYSRRTSWSPEEKVKAEVVVTVWHHYQEQEPRWYLDCGLYLIKLKYWKYPLLLSALTPRRSSCWTDGNYRGDVQGLAAPGLLLASCPGSGVRVLVTASNDLYLGWALTK